ncbi:2-haloalkanoic acid dehalogenase [Vibrio inusitatus NBRC 102082]|uniref:2-haloalkanoic acid dehalogenase n=1 Tax=Vibrio inusitatus NBRC 102082 TaxID=1219070 RepID=A0A4Y3HY77_9VIBR|nr:HAD-IA family hydrolase [Vibrio inusitatus]GEA51214.1 2-haloalkanoic acid dehalogenase [Vibrio inusitatus NBRC 102082]
MRFFRSLDPVHAMTFDLDDTLYDNHPVIRRLERDLRSWLIESFPRLGQFTEEHWRALKRQALQSNERCRNDVTFARETQLGYAFTRIGVIGDSQTQAIQDTMYQVTVLRNRVEIPEETHSTLKAIAAKLPLVAITNGNVDIERIGLQGYFAYTLKAGPDGDAKPSADMFLRATELLDIPGASILHVGDHLVSDVLGAKAAGFQAAWFNDTTNGIESQIKIKVMPDVEINRIEQLLHFI